MWWLAGYSAESAAAAAEAATGELMEVMCPAELAEDRKLRIALPDGRQFDVLVPDGVAVGEEHGQVRQQVGRARDQHDHQDGGDRRVVSSV